MELRKLGDTGIAVSPLGLGTVKLGRTEQVKYPHAFRVPSDAEVRELLAMAWDGGINLIDTAPAYGNSEERLGRLLPPEQDWVVVTKVGERFEHGRSQFDFSAAATRASVEASLRRLGREVVDVVLVHSDGNDMRIVEHEEVLSTLAELKREGWIRAYGMSTKTVAGGLWVVKHCDVVMATCNVEEHQDIPVLEAAEQHGAGVLIKKGLQSGHADSAVGGRGIEASLRFIFGQPGVGSVIVGTINPAHLQQNIELTRRVLSA